MDKSKSGFERDSELISKISFSNAFTREQKNKAIKKIESRIAEEEQREIDGIGTGYFGLIKKTYERRK